MPDIAQGLSAHLRAKPVPLRSIPVIDFAPFLQGGEAGRRAVALAIGRACRDIGFFYLAGHGVAPDMVDRVFALSRAFFALPLEAKQRLHVRHSPQQRGWFGVGDEGYTRRGDCKEGFDMALDLGPDDPDVIAGTPFHGPNVYPAEPADFAPVMRAYHAALVRLAGQLCRAFALALDIPETFFDDKIDKPIAMLRVLHYPPQQGPIDPDFIGIFEHADYGAVSILAQDQVGGLQIRNADGDWIAAPPIPGTFVCNIGEAMARWTNELWPATLHRVINNGGRDRYSAVLFFDPNYAAEIRCLPTCQGPGNPPRHAPITMGRHLTNRFDQTFKHRTGAA